MNNSGDPARRKVMLRSERNGPDERYLQAYLDDHGNLRLDGQDLGPGTALISGDGEYEYFKKIAATDIPRLLALLGAAENDDVLDVLEAHWRGSASYELEDRLRESDLRIEFGSWSG